MQPNGRPRTEVDVLDLSVIRSGGNEGVSAVEGLTQWGDVDTPKRIKDWDDFILNFGGFTENWNTPVETNFPLLCWRALQRGATLLVNRVGTRDAESGEVNGTAPTATIGGITFNGRYKGDYNVNIVIVEQTIAGITSFSISETPVSGDLSRFTRTVSNLPATLTAENLETLNNTFRFVTIPSLPSAAITGATGAVTGGTFPATIPESAYIGTAETATGLYSFDEYSFSYLAVPDIATPTMDVAIASYANTRKDIAFILRTPTGIAADLMIEYRQQTGAYPNGNPIYDWRGRMTTGGLRVIHPVTQQLVEVSEIGDFLGVLASKDNNFYPWLAAAGTRRGVVNNTAGVIYNLGTTGRSAQANLIADNGIIPVVMKNSEVMFFDNVSLQNPENKTLLWHANVVDLVLYLSRALKPIAESELFEPNDIQTWKTIYRNVKKLMDNVQANRGVYDWMYQGDQDVSDISQAVVNRPENIDAGMYQFNLWIQPLVALKYVGIQIAVTNSGVSFDEIIGEIYQTPQ